MKKPLKNKIKCFISYSHDDVNAKKFNEIETLISKYYINLSENEDKSMFSNKTIWKYLYRRIAQSTCTILLLTEDLFTYNKHKIEYKANDFINSGWIYNEISASLRNWTTNIINAVVCVIDDNLISKIKDFSLKDRDIEFNYDLPKILSANKEYIVFVSHSLFINNHYYFISKAMDNRYKQIQSNGKKFYIRYNLHLRN